MEAYGGYRPRRKRRVYGGSKFTDFFKKAHNYVKQHHLISGIANALGTAGVPYANKVGSVASSLGYGLPPKRRAHKVNKKKVHVILHPGGALTLAGGKIHRTRRVGRPRMY